MFPRYTIRFDLSDVETLPQRYSDAWNETNMNSMEKAISLLTTVLRKKLPSVFGHLMRALTTDVSHSGTRTLGSVFIGKGPVVDGKHPGDYMLYVEEGTDPAVLVPLAKLFRWAKQKFKLSDRKSWTIARGTVKKIRSTGLEGKFIFKKTKEQYERSVVMIYKRNVRNMVALINGS
jgi:hypothetical protein